MIVAVIPVHGRAQMAIETVRMLRHQTVSVAPILVGDSLTEARIAKQVGCEYIQYPNRPLSSKWQVGMWRAGDLNKTILTIGSDTWLTPTWCETGLQKMQEGYHVVGRNDFYIMHLTRDGIEIIHRGYTGERIGQPAGIGRMVSREGMRELGWVLFRERRGRHCDTVAMRAIMAAELRCALIPASEKALTIKCDDWTSRHTFAEVEASAGLQPLEGITGNIETWLASTFPGSLEAIDRLRKGTWPKVKKGRS
jgi:hypothetical protein